VRHGRQAPAARHGARASEERSLSLSTARFIGSFPRADVPLAPARPEIALLGRSNVGKSSLLNALVGRRIARVSATPGKTRALTVYELPRTGAAELGFYLLDLPGYGYAKAARTERAAFARLIGHTLERPGLVGVVWLLDIRRHPSIEDRAIQELLAARATAVLGALTKADKLPRRQWDEQERELARALALSRDQLVVTSARAGEGVVELRKAIGGLLAARPQGTTSQADNGSPG
jgi:GTP-binding protein